MFLASLIRVPLARVIGGEVPFITLFPAIIYGAWVGGMAGGLGATFLSAAITLTFVFAHPGGFRSYSPGDLISVARFCVVGVALSILGQARLRSHRQSLAKTDELILSANATREYEARCAAIVNAALDRVVTIDEHSIVVEWNPAAEANFGYSREQAIGQRMTELIIPERYRDAHQRGLAHFLATSEGPILGQRLELPALRANGDEFLAELTVVPLRTASGYLFTAYLRDISERERLAKQRRTLLSEMLMSATEGKLRLCHSATDLPDRLNAVAAPSDPVADTTATSLQSVSTPTQSQELRQPTIVPIEHPYVGLAHLRRLVREEAERLGFSAERRDDLITAASEPAMNAATHAGAGQAEVSSSPERGLIQVIVTDHGAGIEMEHLPQAALSRGYSTKATLGHGLKMMIEMADRLYLFTGSDGTTVVLEQQRDKLPPPWLQDG